jgi:hypothetical protein
MVRLSSFVVYLLDESASSCAVPMRYIEGVLSPPKLVIDSHTLLVLLPLASQGAFKQRLQDPRVPKETSIDDVAYLPSPLEGQPQGQD